MSGPLYSEGQRVRLAEHEGLPEQDAKVLSAEVMSWGISYVVEVKQDEDDPSDDGIREITEEQIKEVLK